VSDFHEEFEGQAAGGEAVAAEAQDAAESSAKVEPELSDIDADGAGHEASPTGPAVDGDAFESPESELVDIDADGASVGSDLDALVAQAAKADEYLALAQRTKADFDNFRKRAARDAALAAERGTIKLAKELLPALDNLERAIAHAAEEDPLLEGIKFVHSDLLAALGRAGIESFSPAGESFDPQLHEAVAQHPQEGAEAGTVLEVYQQGYRLADTVLRPARVLVAA
jgi:molecular chaperone GrpE